MEELLDVVASLLGIMALPNVVLATGVEMLLDGTVALGIVAAPLKTVALLGVGTVLGVVKTTLGGVVILEGL